MNVAVVRNTRRGRAINEFGNPCPERYGRRTVERVVQALRDVGHEVSVLEGDKTLLAELERVMPPDPDTGLPGGIVLNLAYGLQGEARYTHVPAMLELAGVPYTGSTPLGHAVSLDKAITKRLLLTAGIPTPDFMLMDRPGAPRDPLTYPLIVKPRHESTSYGLQVAHDRDELDHAVEAVVREYGQAALVEQYIDGREVCVSLLGNDPPEVLPVVELAFEQRSLRVMTWDDKYHRRDDEPEKLCPAPLAAALQRTLDRIAVSTFAACQARDYARVDVRIDSQQRPYVLEINSMASLGGGGSFVRAAEVAGDSFEELVNRIIDVAHLRYFGTRAPRAPLAPVACLNAVPA